MAWLWLPDEGCCGSQWSPPAPRDVARSSDGPPQPAEPGWMGRLSAPHWGNWPSPWRGWAGHLAAISAVPTPGRSHTEAILPSLHSKATAHTWHKDRRPTDTAGRKAFSSSPSPSCRAHPPRELCPARAAQDDPSWEESRFKLHRREEAWLWGLGLALLHRAQLEVWISGVGGHQPALSGRWSPRCGREWWHAHPVNPGLPEVCKVDVS